MAISREKKEHILQELLERFQKAESVFFSDYRGLSVKDMEELRGKLREHGLEMKIAKKTLVKMASKKAGLPALDENVFEGPISVTFSYENPVVPAKILHTFAKTHEALEIRGGFMEGKILRRDEVTALALIPSREELIAQFVGSLKAPVSGFFSVLSGTLRGFVYALSAVKEKKEQTCQE